MLVSHPVDDSEWPSELLQLRDRFAEKYDAQIAELKIEHENEIVELKEEHLKKLNNTLERVRRRSLKDEESSWAQETDVIKERYLDFNLFNAQMLF